MTWNRALKITNILFPLIGIGVTAFYDVCDTNCSSLQGTFLGLDLKWIGIFFIHSRHLPHQFHHLRFLTGVEIWHSLACWHI